MENVVQQEARSGPRLKASALQLTIVISLIISILLGCLIYLFYFYKLQESRFSHKDRMLQLMDAAIVLAQSKQLDYGEVQMQNLVFADDSIRIHKEQWGLYDLLTVHTYYQRDSSSKAFLLGLESIDSTVLYVADEDRNLSVSGKTRIAGHAYLPKSGIRPAFVDGKFFQGKEEIVEGNKSDSNRELPSTQAQQLRTLWDKVKSQKRQSTRLYPGHNSFLDSTLIHSDSLPISITGDNYQGRFILHSDSLIHIDGAAQLQDIVCIAPVVRIAKGFRGRLQVFAKDSIILEDQVHLSYPSALVLWAENENSLRYIKTGKDCEVYGSLWLYEAKRSRIPHLINLGENNKIHGDLIAMGMLKYKKPLQIIGSSYCYRFITQTQSALYENFLIDIELDRKKLNPFFLHGQLWEQQKSNAKYQILQWLD